MKINKKKISPSKQLIVLRRQINNLLGKMNDCAAKKDIKLFSDTYWKADELNKKYNKISEQMRKKNESRRKPSIDYSPKDITYEREGLEDRIIRREKALANWYDCGSNGYGVREWQERNWRL